MPMKTYVEWDSSLDFSLDTQLFLVVGPTPKDETRTRSIFLASS